MRFLEESTQLFFFGGGGQNPYLGNYQGISHLLVQISKSNYKTNLRNIARCLLSDGTIMQSPVLDFICWGLALSHYSENQPFNSSTLTNFQRHTGHLRVLN